MANRIIVIGESARDVKGSPFWQALEEDLTLRMNECVKSMCKIPKRRRKPEVEINEINGLRAEIKIYQRVLDYITQCIRDMEEEKESETSE